MIRQKAGALACGRKETMGVTFYLVLYVIEAALPYIAGRIHRIGGEQAETGEISEESLKQRGKFRLKRRRINGGAVRSMSLTLQLKPTDRIPVSQSPG